MKYPEHTVTRPLRGEAARKVIKAVDEGKVVRTEASEKTAAAVRALSRKLYGKKVVTTTGKPKS